ncbi:MAG TPA: hypothetical protein VFI58_10315 [Xanthobacteraceae bacterium]|jgi:hypothetical protein|nr:hypothetical protein [Xanthobacteraceae bacterium]
MGRKSCAIGLCLAVIAAMAIAAAPAGAQSNQAKKKPYVYTTQADPKVNRPRARVTVAPRSFLDAGTEVLPGDRKYSDYAFPVGPYATPLSVVQNTGGRVGWHRSPLPGPFDLPSRYNPYPW